MVTAFVAVCLAGEGSRSIQKCGGPTFLIEFATKVDYRSKFQSCVNIHKAAGNPGIFRALQNTYKIEGKKSRSQTGHVGIRRAKGKISPKERRT